VTFDHDMMVGSPTDVGSVLNPANYTLKGDRTGSVRIRGVAYDGGSHTAVLTFDALAADHYHLKVATRIQSAEGLSLAQAYDGPFTAISDLTTSVSIRFTRARSLRSAHTISYDVSVTNTGTSTLLLPLVLQLHPAEHFDGEPLGNQGRAADG